MGFEHAYYVAAEAELKEIREKNKRIMLSREQEVFAACPDIRKMNAELSHTVSEILDLIAEHDGSFREKIAVIEKRNLELQEGIRRKLVEHGYREDYLDKIYDCGICRDSGVAPDGRRCSCFMDKVRREAARSLNNSSPLKLCSFDDFSLDYYDDTERTQLGCTARKAMSENLAFCRRYAEDFHIPYKSVLMRGKTGLGKTHLSLSIASAVLEKGYSVVYGSAPELFRRIEKEHFGSADGDTLGSLREADLVILDDVGAEFDKQFYVSAFYTLLNGRTVSMLPTIVNTNFELSELKAHYGDRITSRLMTMENLIFVGSDIRIIKAREKRG